MYIAAAIQQSCIVGATFNTSSHLYYLLNLKRKVKAKFGNVGGNPVIQSTPEIKPVVSNIQQPNIKINSSQTVDWLSSDKLVLYLNDKVWKVVRSVFFSPVHINQVNKYYLLHAACLSQDNAVQVFSGRLILSYVVIGKVRDNRWFHSLRTGLGDRRKEDDICMMRAGYDTKRRKPGCVVVIYLLYNSL